jgi:hypothetical protein
VQLFDRRGEGEQCVPFGCDSIYHGDERILQEALKVNYVSTSFLLLVEENVGHTSTLFSEIESLLHYLDLLVHQVMLTPHPNPYRFITIVKPDGSLINYKSMRCHTS